MSRRIVVVLAVVFAVVCGAAAFVWLHAGGQGKAVVKFTPEPGASTPENSEGLRSQPGSVPPASRAPKPAAVVARELGFSPAAGEVLEFTGSVAKVSNVASLRLVVSGQKQIAGKDAWHLQAFAHTQFRRS